MRPAPPFLCVTRECPASRTVAPRIGLFESGNDIIGLLSRWTGKQGDGSDLSVGIDETRGVWRGAAGVMVDRRLVLSIGYFPGGSIIEHIATGCTLRATGSR